MTRDAYFVIRVPLKLNDRLGSQHPVSQFQSYDKVVQVSTRPRRKIPLNFVTDFRNLSLIQHVENRFEIELLTFTLVFISLQKFVYSLPLINISNSYNHNIFSPNSLTLGK